ncbi:NAD kinase [Abyssicoccus albus]|uniref:NAD kinase n=1 Tax=Abyssicoccus albus TaxID=1817405 RepID=UPI00097E3C4E|nr:NAD kinase [Abyssicoccus albus]AQL56489.1 NAD kinase [Abyssicoccus albus]
MTETEHTVFIFSSNDELMDIHRQQVKSIVEEVGYTVTSKSQNADLIISIGGDGAFLQAARKTSFNSNAIYIGISTSNDKYLYVDFNINDLLTFKSAIMAPSFDVRKYPVLEVKINDEMVYYCLNELSIRSSIIKTIKMNIVIDDLYFESFNGDGLIISTPTGSTGYSKSLQGAVIDPKLRAFQLTELASVNNNNFRTIGSPMLFNEDRVLTLKMNKDEKFYPIIGLDNEALSVRNIDQIKAKLSSKSIQTLRLNDNSFFQKLQRNFL